MATPQEDFKAFPTRYVEREQDLSPLFQALKNRGFTIRNYEEEHGLNYKKTRSKTYHHFSKRVKKEREFAFVTYLLELFCIYHSPAKKPTSAIWKTLSNPSPSPSIVKIFLKVMITVFIAGRR
jgi:hypothetical protein